MALGKVLLALFCFVSSFLTVTPTHAQEKRPEYIVATTSQIGDLVINLVGDSAKVDFIMGPGIDPHLYRPTRSDMEKLLKADIIFYNGMNLEGKMEDLFHKLEKEKPVISEDVRHGYKCYAVRTKDWVFAYNSDINQEYLF